MLAEYFVFHLVNFHPLDIAFNKTDDKNVDFSSKENFGFDNQLVKMQAIYQVLYFIFQESKKRTSFYLLTFTTQAKIKVLLHLLIA